MLVFGGTEGVVALLQRHQRRRLVGLGVWDDLCGTGCARASFRSAAATTAEHRQSAVTRMSYRRRRRWMAWPRRWSASSRRRACRGRRSARRKSRQTRGLPRPHPSVTNPQAHQGSRAHRCCAPFMGRTAGPCPDERAGKDADNLGDDDDRRRDGEEPEAHLRGPIKSRRGCT